MGLTTALVVAAVFLGALTRATFGFGEAVVSMPLLALLPVPLPTAVALVGLIGLTVAALTVFTGWRHVAAAVVGRLAVATALGVPAGLLLVRLAPARVVTTVLGVLLVGYGGYLLAVRSPQPRLAEPGWAYLFGFLAGSLGAAYNFNGVPVVVYGRLGGWDRDRFRGTLQAHFLASGAMVVAGQGLAGLWTGQLAGLYAWSLPAAGLAAGLGTALHRRLPAGRFFPAVAALLVLLGLLLITRGVLRT